MITTYEFLKAQKFSIRKGKDIFRDKGELQHKTRLESKVFSLEMFYPSCPVEVSKSQTNIRSEKILGLKIYGSKEFLGPNIYWVKKDFEKNFGSEKILGLKKIK